MNKEKEIEDMLYTGHKFNDCRVYKITNELDYSNLLSYFKRHQSITYIFSAYGNVLFADYNPNEQFYWFEDDFSDNYHHLRQFSWNEWLDNNINALHFMLSEDRKANEEK